MNTKVCTKCEKELPETNDYFSKDHRKDGRLRSRCKKCVNEDAKKQQSKIGGTCLQCDQPKRKNKKYCSSNCANKYNSKKKHKANSGNHIQCSTCKKHKCPRQFSYFTRGDINSGKKEYCKRCGANERERKRNARTWRDDATKSMFDNAKQRAKKSGIPFTITKEDIIIPDVCPALGIKLSTTPESRKKKYAAPSIDRIDNSKGYTKDNTVVVSCRANLLKRDATVNEMVALSKYYENLGTLRENH